MSQTKGPAEVSASPGQMNYESRLECSSRPPSKKERVLAAFVAGETLDRWSAARTLRDSCLNSSVPELEADGIKIDRWSAVAHGHFGPVRHCKYRLNRDAENVARARAMLADLRRRRGAGDVDGGHDEVPH